MSVSFIFDSKLRFRDRETVEKEFNSLKNSCNDLEKEIKGKKSVLNNAFLDIGSTHPHFEQKCFIINELEKEEKQYDELLFNIRKTFLDLNRGGMS